MSAYTNHRVVSRLIYFRRTGSGRQSRGSGWTRYLCVLLAAFTAIALSHSIAASPPKEVRRILILNEVGSSYPATKLIDEGIQAALQNSPYQLEFYSEYMDTVLFPDPAAQQEFRDFYIRKYQNRRPDVIITAGPSPLKFMLEVHQTAFLGVPIIFCLPNGNVPGTPALDSNFTGVENDMAPAETLEIALRLQPGTKHVVVVSGVSDFDKRGQASFMQSLKAVTDQVDIMYMTDLAMPDLLERLRQLPNHTVVLLNSVGQDAAGTRFKSNEVGQMVADAANAPVFGLFDVFLNHGEVGGYLSSLSGQGRIAGGMALRILNGEKPQDIPRVKGVNAYMFDWRALRRWGLKESDLPPGSIVLNRETTFWEAYQRKIITGVLVLLAQTLVIIALLWQRAKRRQTEAQLVRYSDQLRLAMESGKSVGWDWDLISGRDSWFGDLRTMFGISSDTFTGKVGDFYRYVHPEDRKQVSEAVAEARQEHKPYVAEYRILWPDGTIRWIVARGIFEYARNGAPTRMLGMAVDITDLKRAEEAERAAENRFKQFFDTLPEYCFVTSADGEILDINPTACSALGYPKEELIGKPLSVIYAPGAVTRLIDLSEKWKKMGTLHNEEIEVLTKEGQKRTVLVNAGSVKDAHGNLLHTMTVQVDITERKQAQIVLQESEERFRHVANTAPVMIWMADADKLCIYVNVPWLKFTGRSLEKELGNGWVQGVHPDDLQGCWETYTKAFDRRKPFQMEYRVRRYDGEYRWVLDLGVPRLNSDGSFAGFIGSRIDVTDQKLAQETLSDMSRKLIEAHEQERTWIARELHDDFNQRIALLTVSLERLKQDLPALAPAVMQGLEEILEHVSSLGSDIQALSHRLHSSKLEYLGIAAAAAGFCRELSDKHGVQIDFHAEGVPKELRQEIALCLFRILQEGLQNAIKHSGSQHFEVRLTGVSNEIELRVRDWGIGFEPEEAMRGHGLGLTSMRERLRLVRGKFSIDSQPGRGTIIRVTVSNGSASRAALA